MVGPCHADQSVDAVNLLRQSTDGAVGSFGVMEGARTKMATYQRDHLIDQIVPVGQPLKKASRRSRSFRFMSARADVPIFLFGRDRFAEVVTEHA